MWKSLEQVNHLAFITSARYELNSIQTAKPWEMSPASIHNLLHEMEQDGVSPEEIGTATEALESLQHTLATSYYRREFNNILHAKPWERSPAGVHNLLYDMEQYGVKPVEIGTTEGALKVLLHTTAVNYHRRELTEILHAKPWEIGPASVHILLYNMTEDGVSPEEIGTTEGALKMLLHTTAVNHYRYELNRINTAQPWESSPLSLSNLLYEMKNDKVRPDEIGTTKDALEDLKSRLEKAQENHAEAPLHFTDGDFGNDE